MNYTQIFAAGGITKAQAAKGEETAEVLLNTLQSLGIDMDQAVNVLNSLAQSNPEMVPQLSDYANTINNPDATEDERASAVQELLKVFKPESVGAFKCGGKLQQLLAKGGHVDCGCGGVKLGQEGFKTSGTNWTPESGRVRYDIEVTPTKDTLVRFAYPSYNGEAILSPQGGRVKEWDNTGGFGQQYHDSVWAQNHPRKALPIFHGKLNNDKVANIRQLVLNHLPAKQQGGIMMEEMPGYDVNTNLTRRQARQLATQNQGYSGEQFQNAMANAMNALRNQGSRGKELRERAREMAAGISPVQKSIVTQTQSIFGDITPIKEEVQRRVVPIPTSTTVQELTTPQEVSLDNLSFADAFAQSRKSGAKTFDWRGKSYGTNLATPSAPKTSTQQGTTGTQTSSYNEQVSQQRRYLNDIIGKASAYPEWFWSDDESANAARKYLYELNGGQDVIRDIYNNYTPAEMQRTINYKKLPHDISANRTIADQQARTEQAGKTIAKGAAILAGSLAAAEALPYLVEHVPGTINTFKNGIWNPVQGRVGTWYHNIGTGAGTRLAENASGRIVSRAGMNVNQFTPGTDFAQTMLRNLQAVTPYGFKCGGKVKAKKAECGVKLKPAMKCGGKTKKK